MEWWQLGTRGARVVLLGLWLCSPWAIGHHHWDIGHLSLAAVLLVSLGVAGASLLRDPHDMVGQLSMEAGALDAGSGPVPDGEWHHHGRTLAGQRYSPLNQIDTTNVA